MFETNSMHMISVLISTLKMNIIAKGLSMTKFPYEVNSWTILSGDIFIKNMDKSVYLYKSTGIPMKIKRFWEIDNMKLGESKTININYQEEIYNFSIHIDKLNRAKLSWYSDFNAILKNRYKSLVNKYRFETDEESNISNEMRFVKRTSLLFDVEFIDSLISDENSYGDFICKDNQCIIEGRKIMQYTSKYERNKEAREVAIKYHGCKCYICQFDFEKKYGEIGRGFIEIHHKKPLYINTFEILLNPKDDLVPVCSNCHSMIHRKKNEVLSIEEVRKRVQLNEIVSN